MFIKTAVNIGDYEKVLEGLREELKAALVVAGRIPTLELAIRSLESLAKIARPPTMQTIVGTDATGKELPDRAVAIIPAAPTMLEATETVLREFNRSMHIKEIVLQLKMRGVGNPDVEKLQLSLTGSLDRAVSRKRVFRKTAPGMYDLIRGSTNGHGS